MKSIGAQVVFFLLLLRLIISSQPVLSQEVNANDADRDGIDNTIDSCPSTQLATQVNAAGCRLPAMGVSQTLEAEDYQQALDTTSGNTGGAYRGGDVDIEVTSDQGGGYNVGWTADGEQLIYDLKLAPGIYDIETRVASAIGGAKYTLQFDQTAALSDEVGNTRGWQTFETHKLGQLDLYDAAERLTVTLAGGELNLNWIRLTAVNVDADNDTIRDMRDECADTPAGDRVDHRGCTIVEENIRIEAEDYDRFHDLSAGNFGGAYRQDEVDIEPSSDTDGGFNVGWTQQGEWLEYDLDLGPGSYSVSTRVASQNGNAQYAIYLDNQLVGFSMVDGTGSWQTFIDQDVGTAVISGGAHRLRVVVDFGEFNINWIKLTKASDTPDARTLIWRDEFDTLDRSVWQHNPSEVNGEIQTYTDDPKYASVREGILTLSAIKEDGQWRSARFRSKGKKEFNYGSFETRVRMPAHDGAFPAVWMQGHPDVDRGMGWPRRGEIDIVEYQSLWNYTPSALHFQERHGGNSVTWHGDNTDLSEWRVHRVDWTPDYIEAYEDGELVGRYDRPENPTQDNWPYHGNSNFYLLINLAVAPFWGTQPDSTTTRMDFEIDYIRVYEMGRKLVESGVDTEPCLASDSLSGCPQDADNVDIAVADLTGDGTSSTDPNTGGDTTAEAGGTAAGTGQSSLSGNEATLWFEPLYPETAALSQPVTFDRGDALVTRIADRARDRHAKENHFQAYDHYLPFYWEQRTAQIEIVDYVAKGGSGIAMTVFTESKLADGQAENRWFYLGTDTLAQYCGNGAMTEIAPNTYFKESNYNCREGREIRNSDKLEFEVSQFLDTSYLKQGRANYYGSTYLYIVGEGLVPWDVTDNEVFLPGDYLQRDSVPIAKNARLGGDTTLHIASSAEPDGHFQQMATNLAAENGQAFVRGRRLHHSSAIDGQHDEFYENGSLDALAATAGPHFINQSCSSCHVRNGRAAVPEIGEPLTQWVVKVGDSNGKEHPLLGHTLQPQTSAEATSEGSVTIAYYNEENGLLTPFYEFIGERPATFSARIAPQLVGLGLLEAIPEEDILALADPDDADNDGISGRPQRTTDPLTGQARLGRFGYKAGSESIHTQITKALNTDMGVMTEAFPSPDCGQLQSDCGTEGAELDERHVQDLVRYVSLLGVRPQRDSQDPAVQNGGRIFTDIGCTGCHVKTLTTSRFHPFAELRNQTIHPYTDLLLHDMGPGLTDTLAEAEASGSEWRTAPLWGLGLSACVTGGTEGSRGWDAFGLDGYQRCTPEHSYLHDGRARTIDEAIRWHGGEANATRENFEALAADDKSDMLMFLMSL